MLDVVAAICLVAGSFLALAAGIGVLRFPDLLARMHASSKPQVLGVLLGLTGLAIRLRVGPAIWTLALVAIFQMLTTPVATHLVARAGYRTGKIQPDRLVVDELTEDLLQAKTDTPGGRGSPPKSGIIDEGGPGFDPEPN